MKLALIIIILTLSALIPISIITGNYGLLIGFILSLVVVFILYYINKGKEKVLLAKINEISSNKVWNIPIERNCQHCQTLLKFDFDLETTEIECAHCNEVNKLTLDVKLFPKDSI